MTSESLTVGLVQIAPVWLDRAATLAKVNSCVEQAAGAGCSLAIFDEVLVPWLVLLAIIMPTVPCLN